MHLHQCISFRNDDGLMDQLEDVVVAPEDGVMVAHPKDGVMETQS
jgi:hypothetical protein